MISIDRLKWPEKALVDNFFGPLLFLLWLLAVILYQKNINVQMNRFFLLNLMAFLAFFSLQAAEVTFDFSTAEGITAMGYAVPDQSAGTNLTQAGPVTVGGVTLSAVDGATPTRIWNSQGSFSLRIYVDGSITLSVAEGSITGITVNAANTTNFDLLADVGDYSVTDGVGTWTGSSSSVTITHYGSKNAQVASIVVTTDSEGPVDPDPEDPIDPNITKLDSLHHLAALEDGTAFQFISDVYVNFSGMTTFGSCNSTRRAMPLRVSFMVTQASNIRLALSFLLAGQA